MSDWVKKIRPAWAINTTGLFWQLSDMRFSSAAAVLHVIEQFSLSHNFQLPCPMLEYPPEAEAAAVICFVEVYSYNIIYEKLSV